MMQMPEIIFMDNHLLICNKPAGLLVQGDKTNDQTLLDITKKYLKQKFSKPGNVYLGLIHRLDRPVSGIVILAKTSKAASRLSKQFREKTIQKKYYAIIQGKMPKKQATLINQIKRENVNSIIVTKDGQYAELEYQIKQQNNKYSLLDINLKTGRHHQIRVQLTHQKHPILGDFRYGSKHKFHQRSIALHAYLLTINHPITKEKITFTTPMPKYWQNILKT